MFFKRTKRITAEQLGTLIAATVLSPLENAAYEKFLREIGLAEVNLPPHHWLETLAGHLFAGLLAVQQTYEPTLTKSIMQGCNKAIAKYLNELSRRLKDVGLNELDLSFDLLCIVTREGTFTFEKFISRRLDQYSALLTNNSGAGPSFHIGKQFYWNIVGREEPDVNGAVVASIYLFGTVDGVKHMLGKVHII